MGAEPIAAVFDAPIDAPNPFCDDVEFRDQVSSAHESVGLAVFLTSGMLEPLRGEDAKSDSRGGLVRDVLLAALPIEAPIPLLLLVLVPQGDPNVSVAAVVRLAEDADDGWSQLDDVLELGIEPRKESVVSAGPLSNDDVDDVLSGAKPLDVVVSAGTTIGGAAIDEPMLVQPPLDCDDVELVNKLRSTGVMGADEFEPEVGGAGRLEPVVHGGGDTPRVEELVDDVAGCVDVVNGFVDCDG